MHEDNPAELEYSPAEQLLHLVDPDKAYEPALQIRQPAEEERPGKLEYFPVAHNKHNCAAMSIEYLPSGQLMHALDPDKE